MAASKFNGSTCSLTTSIGGVVTTAAHTLVAVFRRNTVNSWDGIISCEGSSSNQVRTSFEASDASALSWGTQASAVSGTTATQANSTTTWYGAAASHGAGTASVNFVRRDLTTPGTVGNETTAASIALSATQATKVLFGNWTGSDPYDGWIGVCAYFNLALTVAQMTECFANRRTSDIWNNSAGRPVGLWELNTSSIVDLVGTANETTRTGVTLDATEVPPWTYDGLGAVYTPKPNSLPYNRAGIQRAAVR